MINNREDYIDSRDVIERISEMELEASSRWEEATEFPEGEGPSYGELADVDHCAWLDPEDAEELRQLRSLEEQAGGYSDWLHGVTLIRDSYFVTYAQELSDDLHGDTDTHWPFTCVDWELAARELQMDYTSVDFDGVTYWVR